MTRWRPLRSEEAEPIEEVVRMAGQAALRQGQEIFVVEVEGRLTLSRHPTIAGEYLERCLPPL